MKCSVCKHYTSYSAVCSFVKSATFVSIIQIAVFSCIIQVTVFFRIIQIAVLFCIMQIAVLFCIIQIAVLFCTFVEGAALVSSSQMSWNQSRGLSDQRWGIVVRFKPFFFFKIIWFNIQYFVLTVACAFSCISTLFQFLCGFLLLLFYLLLLPPFYEVVHPYEGVGSISPCLGPGNITIHNNKLNYTDLHRNVHCIFKPCSAQMACMASLYFRSQRF